MQIATGWLSSRTGFAEMAKRAYGQFRCAY